MTYQAPVNDMLDLLKSSAGFEDLVASGIYAGLDTDTVRAILEEAGRFGAEVLDPLNAVGDRAGSRLENGAVHTPPGWPAAYRAFRDAGWSALPCPETFGGQGLPEIVSTAVGEIWNAANLSFGLCPLLTQGAIHALEATGSEELKRLYLPRMVSGEWTGTMNLTEPHAGSDLGALKARAEHASDGTYRIFGTKIFITYGEHDLAENIIHMVLARLPDAPAGTRGISLFLVPKFIPDAAGRPGRRNDVICAGLEHKLGIHASPTCTMKYGEQGGAVGWLVGEENKGLAAMFIMMNAARLAVGVQGVAVADRATQRALAYAKERRQGRIATTPAGDMTPIVAHPNIRRKLLTMQALTRAARAICYATAREIDISHRAASEPERKLAAARAALLTPVAKAFATDIGVEVASLGVQIHGGMGFVEETGAAQYYRDARILPIYEGTNGIQAIDLVTRKLPLENGAVAAAYIADLEQTSSQVARINDPRFGATARRLTEAIAALKEASMWMGKALQSNPDAAIAGSSPYLRLFGITAGAAYLARSGMVACREDGPHAAHVVGTARFFAENIAVAAAGLATTVTSGSDAVLTLKPDELEA